jgi:hypothetical protein
MFCLLADDDDEFTLVVDLLRRGRGDHNIFVMGDQRVLRAIADFGTVRDGRHLAALIGGLLEVLQVVQSDAIEGARDQRQLDLDAVKRVRLRGALPFAERLAVDLDDAIAFDDAPRGLTCGREFEPAHDLSFYSAAACCLTFHAPAAGRFSPRFSRKVWPV